jgi:hypothetical protein
MCRSKRVLCIVGALVAVLFAVAAPGYACDECLREQVRVDSYEYREPIRVQRVQRVEHYEYAEPVIERVVRRERVIVEPEYVEPVCVERVRVERVRRAPIERVRVERVRGHRRAGVRSKSIQIERSRSY